jgi:hypothetical protein
MLVSKALRFALLCLFALLLSAASAAGQRAMAVKLEKVEVGFRSQSADQSGLFKSGLWSPVHVTVQADGPSRGKLVLESVDADGGPNVYSVPFRITEKGRATIIGYTMPAANHPDLGLSLVFDEEPERRLPLPTETASAIGLQQHLYLSLGNSLPDLHAALEDQQPTAGGSGPRFSASEREAERLPDLWFGYDGVDLAVLTSGDDHFLKELECSPARVRALAEWVQYGGRLLVSVSRRNQERVHKLLSGPAWRPDLPPIVPASDHATLTSLPSVQNWARIPTKPFPVSSRRPLVIPKLNPGKSAEVLFREEETGDPILLRLPYGRGSISFLALSVDQGAFTKWEGRVEFWKALLNALAPRVQSGIRTNPNAPILDETGGSDAASELQRELDRFDLPAISFGWVAFFILLYILLAGPLDYLILKKVFKHLEWTWITFPALIVLVSVAAYFTADALKGSDLKINKVDLVDIDQRSDPDSAGRTPSAQVYGTTWFTILSPRIQGYTLGLKPALASWPGGVKSSDVMVTWLGRPEAGLGYGRRRAQALFSRSYRYAHDASGLRDVAIPIWTTKSFSASWSAVLGGMPLAADLHYHPGDPEQRLEGTLLNQLPVTLEEVYLFYGNKAYPLATLKPGGDHGLPLVVTLDQGRAESPERWAQSGEPRGGAEEFAGSGGRPYDPVSVLKRILFHEYSGGNNHAYRRLDESWRLRELQARDEQVRDAILVGRVRRAYGAAQKLTQSGDPRLPTHLWLGNLPGEGQTRPALPGTLTQDTYIRVFLPVRPQ